MIYTAVLDTVNSTNQTDLIQYNEDYMYTVIYNTNTWMVEMTVVLMVVKWGETDV
jgi:hypothetical protein